MPGPAADGEASQAPETGVSSALARIRDNLREVACRSRRSGVEDDGHDTIDLILTNRQDERLHERNKEHRTGCP